MINKKLLQKYKEELFVRCMDIKLFGRKHVDFGLRNLKVVTSIWKTKNGLGNRKNLKTKVCKGYFYSAQSIVELPKELNVTSAAISKRSHAVRKVQKKGKWVPHKLPEIQILNCFPPYQTQTEEFFVSDHQGRWRVEIFAF